MPWNIPAGSQVSTIDERIKLVLGASLSASEPVGQFNVFGLNVGDQVRLIAARGALQADTHLAGRLADLFEIVFHQPIAFADHTDFEQWLSDLGSAPGLASKDGRFWLPIPSMGEHAQFDTVAKPSGTITLRGVTVTGLRSEHKLAIGGEEGDEVGIVGSVGARPIDLRRVNACRDSRFWIIFDLPIDFAGEQAFEDWLTQLGDAPSLASVEQTCPAADPRLRQEGRYDGACACDGRDCAGF